MHPVTLSFLMTGPPALPRILATKTELERSQIQIPSQDHAKPEKGRSSLLTIAAHHTLAHCNSHSTLDRDSSLTMSTVPAGTVIIQLHSANHAPPPLPVALLAERVDLPLQHVAGASMIRAALEEPVACNPNSLLLFRCASRASLSCMRGASRPAASTTALPRAFSASKSARERRSSSARRPNSNARRFCLEAGDLCLALG